MATITIPKKQLQTAVKESVREVFEQELMKFRALLLPFVSKKEQKDIEKRYGKPFRKIAKSIRIEL
ncbi:hypothetical protein KKB71_00295 [Patescibacteria group bacterium]|nr:hypothetical protein [Patescibacteria group bacterium]